MRPFKNYWATATYDCLRVTDETPNTVAVMPVSQPQTYCADRPSRDMFVNGETSRDAGAEGFRTDLAANSLGALCYSWVKALDLYGRSQDPVPLPPAVYIAVLRTNRSAREVWMAPAGTDATLNGVVGLGGDLSRAHVGLRPGPPLNPPAATANLDAVRESALMLTAPQRRRPGQRS